MIDYAPTRSIVQFMNQLESDNRNPVSLYHRRQTTAIITSHSGDSIHFILKPFGTMTIEAAPAAAAQPGDGSEAPMDTGCPDGSTNGVETPALQVVRAAEATPTDQTTLSAAD